MTSKHGTAFSTTVRTVVVHNGPRGPQGLPGEKGDKGDQGDSIVATGPWQNGGGYCPLDAVTYRSSLMDGVDSLYVQKSSHPCEASTIPPNEDPARWDEVGAVSFGNAFGGIWEVYQADHGFTAVGTPVAFLLDANHYVSATAADIGIAVVREVVDKDRFLLQSTGEIPFIDKAVIWPGGSDWEAGEIYYVSDVRGRVQKTPPDVPGYPVNPILKATDSPAPGARNGIALPWAPVMPDPVPHQVLNNFRRYHYVATDGQVLFSGPDRDGRVLSYETGEDTVDVFQTGLNLDRVDFTATDGEQVQLSTPAQAGDLVEIWATDTPSSIVLPSTLVKVDDIGGLFNSSRTIFPVTISGIPVLYEGETNLFVLLDVHMQEYGVDYTLIEDPDNPGNAAIQFSQPIPSGTRFSGSVFEAIQSGWYVRKTGDTMTGDLTISKADQYIVGLSDIASLFFQLEDPNDNAVKTVGRFRSTYDLPVQLVPYDRDGNGIWNSSLSYSPTGGKWFFGTLYSDALSILTEGDGDARYLKTADIPEGGYVAKSGDTMTGNLLVNAGLYVGGPTEAAFRLRVSNPDRNLSLIRGNDEYPLQFVPYNAEGTSPPLWEYGLFFERANAKWHIGANYNSTKRVLTEADGDARYLQLAEANQTVTGPLVVDKGNDQWAYTLNLRTSRDDGTSGVRLWNATNNAELDLRGNSAWLRYNNAGIISYTGTKVTVFQQLDVDAMLNMLDKNVEGVRILKFYSGDHSIYHSDTSGSLNVNVGGVWSARLDPAGPSITDEVKSVITAEKGDARYVQLAAQTHVALDVDDNPIVSGVSSDAQSRRVGFHHLEAATTANMPPGLNNQNAAIMANSNGNNGFLLYQNRGLDTLFMHRLGSNVWTGVYVEFATTTSAAQIAAAVQGTQPLRAAIRASATANPFTSGAPVAPEKARDYDRQQNIIDTIDAMLTGLTDPQEIATADLLRAEAVAAQEYLITEVLKTSTIAKAVQQADWDWMAAQGEENP